MSTLAWDDLRYFLAFARAGSMQAAAKALGGACEATYFLKGEHTFRRLGMAQ